MGVVVYGSEGCERCESAKNHIKSMGFAFEYREVSGMTELHEGWRKDESVELLAECCMMATDHVPLPVIQVDGEYLGYTQAMKRLKSVAVAEGDGGKERAAS